MLSGSINHFWCWKQLSTLPHPPATCCHPTSPLPWCSQEECFVWLHGELVVLKPGKNQERLVNHSWKDGEGQQQGLGSGVAQCSAWRSGTSSKAGTHRTDLGAVQERVTESGPVGDSNAAPLGFRAQIHFRCPADTARKGNVHVGHILQELPKNGTVNIFCLWCDLTHDIPQQPSRAKNAILVCIWYN